MGAFRDYLKSLGKLEYLNEIHRTGSVSSRDEYSGELHFNRLKDKLKLVKSNNEYNLLKFKDYLFLVKDNEYIAYLDGTTDYLLSKKAFYISVMHSKERGAMDILFKLMKETGYKYIISDTMLSDDAIKYYEKLMKKHKYFGIDYRDEKVKAFDEELLSNPDYRIVIEL